MIFDKDISIDKITDHKEFYIASGTAPTKLNAYLLAEKLLYAESLNRFELTDVVPSWLDDRFVFYFLKKKDNTKSSAEHTIETPLPREQVEKKFTLKGKCERNGIDIVISGDVAARTKCLDGRWSSELSVLDSSAPIIGVKVSFWHDKLNPYHFHRSFLISDIGLRGSEGNSSNP